MSGVAAHAQGFHPDPARRRIAWSAVGALGLAALLHLALFGLLSLAWRVPEKPPVESKPVEVSLVDEVALDQRAPKSVEPPAQSRAPEQAAPEDAPPLAPAEQVDPAPAPPTPKVEVAPPPKPAPKAAPQPRPVAPKPEKAPEKTRTPSAKAAAPAAKPKAVAKTPGTDPAAHTVRVTGSLLDDDFRKGLSQTPSKSKAPNTAPGATMDAKAQADIASAIQRQVRPCAERHSVSGTGVSRISVNIRLKLNRDGTLSSQPTIEARGGIDDDNRIYVDAVDRAAIASFRECAPLHDLPPEFYDGPRGWKNFIMRYKLPG